MPLKTPDPIGPRAVGERVKNSPVKVLGGRCLSVWSHLPSRFLSQSWGPRTDMFQLGFKPGPPAWEASTLENNFYSEHLHMSQQHGSPQCMCMLHEHTWSAVGCRSNSTCKVDGLLPSRHLASPGVSNHVWVTTIERLDQSHLCSNLEVPGLTCPGWESNLGLPRGKWSL